MGTKRVGLVGAFAALCALGFTHTRIEPEAVASSSYFGTALAFADSTLVIAAPYVWSSTLPGRVHVFDRDGEHDEHPILQGSVVTGGAEFGAAVAVAGDTMVVGAPDDGFDAPNAGAAYVFEFDGATWAETARLVPSDGAVLDRCGADVAIDATLILVGCPQRFDATTDSGAVYVFERSGSDWPQVQKIVHPSPTATDRFGTRIALHDGTLVVAGTSSSGTHVYVDSGAGFAYQDELVRNGDPSGGAFGFEVALRDDLAAVAAAGEDDYTGAIYVFRRSGTSWSQEARLQGPTPTGGDELGWGVAVGDDVVWGGAPRAGEAGEVYRWTWSGAAWSAAVVFEPMDDEDAMYGDAIEVDGTDVLIGASASGSPGANYRGAVYLVTPSAGGVECQDPEDCASGHCVDGVCCDTACGDGADDCEACSGAAGAAEDGVCGPVPDGTDCGDGSTCNGAETCNAGACTAADPPDCDDGDPCTVGTCVEPEGCVQESVDGCGESSSGEDPSGSDDGDPPDASGSDTAPESGDDGIDPDADASDTDGADATGETPPTGCGCRTRPGPPPWLAALLFLGAARRRTRYRPSSTAAETRRPTSTSTRAVPAGAMNTGVNARSNTAPSAS